MVCGKENRENFPDTLSDCWGKQKKGMERIQMNLNNDAYLVNSDFPNEKI